MSVTRISRLPRTWQVRVRGIGSDSWVRVHAATKQQATDLAIEAISERLGQPWYVLEAFYWFPDPVEA